MRQSDVSEVEGVNMHSRDTHALQWRHNDHDSVSNHQARDCLLNGLFRHRSKKAPKLHVTGFCVGNSPVTGEFPAQKASNAVIVSNWWRHHVADDTHCYREVNSNINLPFISWNVLLRLMASWTLMLLTKTSSLKSLKFRQVAILWTTESQRGWNPWTMSRLACLHHDLVASVSLLWMAKKCFVYPLQVLASAVFYALFRRFCILIDKNSIV